MYFLCAFFTCLYGTGWYRMSFAEGINDNDLMMEKSEKQTEQLRVI